jgi:hypothetical protein
MLVIISTDYIGKSIYHTSTSSTILVVISTHDIGKSIYHTSTSSTILVVVISTDYIGKFYCRGRARVVNRLSYVVGIYYY